VSFLLVERNLQAVVMVPMDDHTESDEYLGSKKRNSSLLGDTQATVPSTNNADASLPRNPASGPEVFPK
jgi:hypothetical protein